MYIGYFRCFFSPLCIKKEINFHNTSAKSLVDIFCPLFLSKAVSSRHQSQRRHEVSIFLSLKTIPDPSRKRVRWALPFVKQGWMEGIVCVSSARTIMPVYNWSDISKHNQAFFPVWCNYPSWYCIDRDKKWLQITAKKSKTPSRRFICKQVNTFMIISAWDQFPKSSAGIVWPISEGGKVRKWTYRGQLTEKWHGKWMSAYLFCSIAYFHDILTPYTIPENLWWLNRQRPDHDFAVQTKPVLGSLKVSMV